MSASDAAADAPLLEVEITRPLALDERQAHVIEMHSVLNVLNVAVFQIDAVGRLVGDASGADRFMDLLIDWQGGLADRARTLEALRRAGEIRTRLVDWMEAGRRHADPADRADLDARIENLVSIFAILEERADELLRRTGARGAWTTLSFAHLRTNLERAFRAIEKNSFGRWRIAFSAETRPGGAYLLEMRFLSPDGRAIRMPAVLEDVMRDLAANARKFTPPGGEIRVTLAQDRDELFLRVSDDGRGIPAAEIEEVVRFGHRAGDQSAVAHTGGGFGLTKACAVVREFGGRMWIRSAPGAGTTVTIRIPSEDALRGGGSAPPSAPG